MIENKIINKKAFFVVCIVAILLVVAAAAFYFFDFRDRQGIKDATSLPRGESVLPPLKETAFSDQNKERNQAPYEKPAVSVLPPYGGEPIRQLNSDTKFIASVGAAFLEKYEKNLEEIASRLDKNPKNYDDWLAIAYIKKLFNNYIGARDAWEYAKIVNPENPIAFFNLGELYGYELKEPTKAEGNYKSALQLDPYHLDYYIGLANFYKDVLQDPQKAEVIFISALEKIPNTEPNLFTGIGAFYRDQKNFAKAVEYFEKALELTRDPAMQKNIQDEIDRLRSKTDAQ